MAKTKTPKIAVASNSSFGGATPWAQASAASAYKPAVAPPRPTSYSTAIADRVDRQLSVAPAVPPTSYSTAIADRVDRQLSVAPQQAPVDVTGSTGIDGGAGTGDSTGNALDKWTLEGDPVYMQAMNASQSAFNTAKASALAKMNAEQYALGNQRKALDANAWDARRQLAGNFAARGMQRGAYGAFYRAQDKQNAQQIAAQTDIKDQIAALNQDFMSNYGTAGADWLGTSAGQQARQQAIQLALQNRLTQLGA